MLKQSQRQPPFDAVLLISFGGPQGPQDIRPFLRNVLRGRNIPEVRFNSVVKHYELFGGVSPLTDITLRQAQGLRERLKRNDFSLPVYVGMRNWHPFLEETLQEMTAVGITRVLGLTLAPHHSYSSCEQYKHNVSQARSRLRETSGLDIDVTYITGWHNHKGFVQANSRRIEKALGRLPVPLQDSARLIFAAHSIPTAMASTSRYEAELRESAVLVTRALRRTDWTLVYQSRSGHPEDPWLGPDVCDYLRYEHQRGLKAAVICPIGFVADHIEVLYDLDREAGNLCQEIGLPMARASSVNDDPLFLDMLADVVSQACRRYRRGRPLSIAPRKPPVRTEPPPQAR